MLKGKALNVVISQKNTVLKLDKSTNEETCCIVNHKKNRKNSTQNNSSKVGSNTGMQNSAGIEGTCNTNLFYEGEVVQIKKMKLELHKIPTSTGKMTKSKSQQFSNEVHSTCKVKKTNVCQKKMMINDKDEKIGCEAASKDLSLEHENDDVVVLGVTRKNLFFQPIVQQDKLKLCRKLSISHKHLLRSANAVISNQCLGCPLELKTIIGDGNCFYRSISYAICNFEDNHMDIRVAVVDFLTTNSDIFVGYLGRNFSSVLQYAKSQRIMEYGIWASEIEILVTANLLETDIYIYDEELKCWHIFCGNKAKMGEVTTNRGIYLNHTGGIHYDVVLSVQSNGVIENVVELDETEDFHKSYEDV